MEKAHSSLDPSLASKSILVIDDELLVRESMAVYLEDSGFNVIQAENGRQGVVLFCEFNPDLVLCDLRMPEMDGMTLLKELSELSPDTPVIIISGAGQIHDVVEALRFGALDYLVKPINDMAVLENAVKNALHRTHLEVENQVYKDELETANRELAKNLDLLQKDQDAGRRAQMQLLPPEDSHLKDYHFQHLIIPSLNLSGDFIDYFEISSRYLGFYIADVSGHGSAAAFVTMMLKSLFNQPLRNFKSNHDEVVIHPEQIMDYLNKEFINANLGKHITLFYGVIDCEENQLSYCVAGQYPAPILVTNNRTELLKDDGFPLGLFEWANFKSQQINIGHKFQLLMVSDGWLETIPNDKSIKPASEAFLLDYVSKQPMDLETLLAPVKNYQKENPPDDITIFIVEKE